MPSTYSLAISTDAPQLSPATTRAMPRETIVVRRDAYLLMQGPAIDVTSMDYDSSYAFGVMGSDLVVRVPAWMVARFICLGVDNTGVFSTAVRGYDYYIENGL
ncbi:uncharacterized protein N7500_002798 [Penicillium coprophilum]|uniref:uncharacterized protein n=1 Tax=Penicillium coprophilum TaxID=36646 RepID=UPI00238A1F7A|nr:uncharacterized protein N7500_002798 [Penicillium coprophilum]KAJ5170015.1 hypothetical protein N7500_002798 [Penicillium coprophilum]